MHAKIIPLCLLITGIYASNQAAAATLTFQEGANGYFGTADTVLMSSAPDAYFGHADEVSIDASDGGSPNHVLLRFDNVFGNGPGQIKPGDGILSATVRFQITSVGSGILFHDLLIAWDEDTVTWNSFGAGVQADGVEAVVSPVASIGANNGNANIDTETLTVDLTASLQKVQAGQLPGHGWALLPFMPNGTNGVDFISSEGLPASMRPLLTVEVVPVPEPETYAMLLAGLGLLGLVVRRNAMRGGALCVHP